MKSLPILSAACLLAIGIAAGGYFAGQGLVQSRLGDRMVTVKGLAERPVMADQAFWPIRYVAAGNELAEVQAEMKRATATVTGFLRGQGFTEDELRVETPMVVDRLAQMYQSGTVERRFIIQQAVMLNTTKVEAVAAAAQEAGQLIDAGVVLAFDRGPGRPSYVFNGLNNVKSEMISEAMAQARAAAETFARDSGARLNGIKRANQGQFQILPRDAAPGISQDEQIEKTLRVVSTVQYLLTD